MPAPTPTDRSNRPTLLTVRTTAGEREQLQALAARKGVTVSHMIRQGLALQGFRPER